MNSLKKKTHNVLYGKLRYKRKLIIQIQVCDNLIKFLVWREHVSSLEIMKNTQVWIIRIAEWEESFLLKYGKYIQ